jgi:hypothetical protein
MEQLTNEFSKFNIESNFTRIGQLPFGPRPPQPNDFLLENHKRTVLVALAKYLTTSEVEYILNQKLRSVSTEEAILSDFFLGDIPYKKIKKDNFYAHALKFTENKFKPQHKFRPVHLFDVKYHYPHTRSSNAEAPFSTEQFFTNQLDDIEYRSKHNLPENPKRSFGNMEDIIFPWSRMIHHRIKDNTDTFDKHLYYILLHNKTALIDIGDPNKLRSISGFPRPQNLAFIMFFWALFAHYKRNPGSSPLLWGYETQLGGMFRLNYELTKSYIKTSIVTLDKSRFDKYYSFEIQDDIDPMIESFLDFNNGYIPTHGYPDTQTNWSPHKAQRLQRLWQWLCYSFRATPTVIYDGRLYQRKWFGMPSGIYTTQYYDTIHFCITNATVLFKMGIHESDIILYKGEGDDIIFQLAIVIPPVLHEDFLHEYQVIDDEYFGSLIRPEKCQVHTKASGCTVLGYTNSKGIPKRDPLDLLAQFYHTKQTHPDASRTMATAVGIAHASLVTDKYKQVYKVCKDIYEYYKRQGFTPDPEALRRTLYTGEPFAQLPTCKEFPSIPEIQNKLLSFNFDAPETVQTFWPDWFLADH